LHEPHEQTTHHGHRPVLHRQERLSRTIVHRDGLVSDISFQRPDPDGIFFGIVEPGRAMIMFKDVGIDPVPNYTRGIKQGITRCDAYR
jgi:hypothetical protein